MKKQVITNKRIILGILRECTQFSGFLSISECGSICKFFLKNSQASPGEYEIQLDGERDLSGSFVASFWVHGEFYQGTFEYLGGMRLQIPSSLEQINQRKHDRYEASDLGEVAIVSVLRVPQQISFGRLENISLEHLSIEVQDPGSSVTIGTSGTISNFQSGNLIGSHRIIIADVRRSEGGRNKVLLKVDGLKKKLVRTNIRSLEGEPTAVELFWPDEEGISVPIVINEISGMGISGSLVNRESVTLPVGTVFIEAASGARVRLAWMVEGRVGFSLDTAEPSARERLYTALSTRAGGGRLSPKRKIAKSTLSLLTKSGLVKGERADSYRDWNKREVFHYRSGASRRWLCQVFGEAHYTSFARISDIAWLMQELGSIETVSGSGDRKILDGIKFLRATKHEELRPLTSVVVIYDIGSRFNLEFWRRQLPQMLTDEPIYANVCLGSLKGKRLGLRNGTDKIEVVRPNAGNWRDLFSKIQDKENLGLLAAFGLTSDDYAPRLLNEILLIDGKRLDREVLCLVAHGGETLGFAIKLGLPPLANATSLTENFYVIPTTLDHEKLVRNLFSEANSDLLDVEDICLLGAKEGDADILESSIEGFKPRSFELIRFNLMNLTEEA